MLIRLVEHPYFTRSKAPKASFPDQSLQKGKTIMGDNNDEISLNDVVMAQPAATDQNELIMQLMQ